jgi:uncharacterized membrane protein YqiK
MGTLGWTILLLIILAVIIAVIAWFYERATNEVSLVRTGVRGRRVVIDGGVLAVPYFHEISRVSMATLRLDVDRHGDASLITQDRLRVDVGAEFYVSVKPEAEAITRAAQTLGKRTFQRDELSGLIDGMLVDALRSVAAKMTMDELHENRATFVAEVREMLLDTLSRYGLQLNSVSLTGLDQTPFAALDENNAFNAVGMRKLAEVIANSKKERAQIDADSEVSVRRAAMEASRERLAIELDERRAEIAQQQEVETLSAAQIAEVAQRKADSELSVTMARIDLERTIQAAEVAREQELSIVQLDSKITITAKSQEEYLAQSNLDSTRAKAITASESIETARATAEAERRVKLDEISKRGEAQTAAIQQTIRAENEKAVAKDKAAARREAAETDKVVKIADADATRASIDAENSRSDAMIAMELEKARLVALPKIISEMVKPAEKIKSINVNHVTGLGGSSGGSTPSTPVAAALDSIMDMAVQMPMLKKIGDQMGVAFDDNFEGDNKGKNKDN